VLSSQRVGQSRHLCSGRVQCNLRWVRTVLDDYVVDYEFRQIEVFLQERGGKRLEIAVIVEAKRGVIGRQHVPQTRPAAGGVAAVLTVRNEIGSEQILDRELVLHAVEPTNRHPTGVGPLRIDLEACSFNPLPHYLTIAGREWIGIVRWHKPFANKIPGFEPLKPIGVIQPGREQSIQCEAALVHSIAVAFEAVSFEKLGRRRRRRGSCGILSSRQDRDGSEQPPRDEPSAGAAICRAMGSP